MTIDLLAGWKLWAALALAALVLEFAIGGVGFLAVLAGASALTATALGLAQVMLTAPLTWYHGVFVFTAALAVAILVTRLVWRRPPDGPDVNSY